MKLMVTEIPGEGCPAAAPGRSGPGDGGGTPPAADFTACLRSARQCMPGAGQHPGEVPALGFGPASVTPAEAVSENSGATGGTFPAGAEADHGACLPGPAGKAGVPAGPENAWALPVTGRIPPGGGVAFAPGPAAAAWGASGGPGQSAAEAPVPPATPEGRPAPAFGPAPELALAAQKPLPAPAGPQISAPPGIAEHAADVFARLDPGQGRAVPQAAVGFAEPQPGGSVPGSQPTGVPQAAVGFAEPQPQGFPGRPPAGLDPAPGADRSAAGAALLTDRDSRGHAQPAEVRAELVSERAAPAPIRPDPPAWVPRAGEAASGRTLETAWTAAPEEGTAPLNVHRQLPGPPQALPAAAVSGAEMPRVPVQSAAADVREAAGAPAGFERQVPAPKVGQGQGIPDGLPPGLRPGVLDPYPVARQLTEAVVHHVRHLQIQAGQAVRVSIALEPPELGRVTLKLTFSRLGLEAAFYTADRSVKAVIEQALPHLREALARQEINVGNATVFLGHEEARDQAPQFFRGPWPSPGTPGEPAGEHPSGGRQSESRPKGVDYLV